MSLCKNECTNLSDRQFQGGVKKGNPSPTSKGSQNGGKANSRYTGKIKTLDGIWLEMRQAQLSSSAQEKNGNSGGSSSANNGNGGGSSGGLVSCLPISRESHQGPNIRNGFRIDCTQIGPIHRKGHQRIISIKQLFSNAAKFQKNFQRGIFLSCLIYSEDKILVTVDDVLPSLQIDDDLSSTFHHDFHWLHKISTVWSDAKFLKHEMEKCDSASTMHFRIKLLQTVLTMQENLNTLDLGKLFFKPITTENSNVTFLCTVNHLRATKLISAPNVRWISIEKYKNRKSIQESYDFLHMNYQNLMLYHQMCNIPLGKGLYLGYFKLVTSVDLLKIVVPEKTPSIVPHVKIRNNPHVTKSEWELLLSVQENRKIKTNINDSNPRITELTDQQQTFRQQVDSSLKKLFSNLKIDRTTAVNHRFYTTEVIEISSSVTMIIVLPPVESSCLIEGDSVDLKWVGENKLMTLPVQIFEMLNILTYHNTLGRRLMRLSSTLEVETILAQHNRRKAFSSEEMNIAQTQLGMFTSLQSKLEQAWKDCRWLLEVMKAARAKDNTFITLRDFLNHYNTPSSKFINSPQKTEMLSSGNKFPNKGTYVNASQPLSRLQLQQLLNLRRLQNLQIHPEIPIEETEDENLQKLGDLPGPNIPSNPNFKFESCSSLPIVGKGYTHADKLRPTASLFDMKVDTRVSTLANNSGINSPTSYPSLIQNLSNCSDDFMRLGLHLPNEDEPDNEHPQHYQNLQQSFNNFPQYQNLESVGSSSFSRISQRPPMMLPTPTTQHHQSSRSKLVSLSTMTNILRDSKEAIPGTNDSAGLRGISWTKQRTSLDRCFNLSAAVSTCSSDGSREHLLMEDGNETDSSDVRNASAFRHFSGPASINKIVEVYAAYECGHRVGTCLKLQITWDTTSRQIIISLVTQLNENGGTCNDLDNYCLVVVIGARERVLRMDYKPLRLQRPWDCSRLYVRKRDDVTSAIALESKITSKR